MGADRRWCVVGVGGWYRMGTGSGCDLVRNGRWVVMGVGNGWVGGGFGR